jgi:hypothetical protein
MSAYFAYELGQHLALLMLLCAACGAAAGRGTYGVFSTLARWMEVIHPRKET